MSDFRLKKCEICQKYWCFVNDEMCPNCKSKGYHVETKPMENRLGIPCEEKIKLKMKRKKK